MPTIVHPASAATLFGLAAIDAKSQTLTFAGIGNIRLMAMCKDRTRNLLANPGIVGAGRLRVRPESLALNGGACVVMFSDCIESSLDLSGCPCTLFVDMEALASAIVHGWGRGHDDAGVIAWYYPAAWRGEDGIL